MRTKLILRLEKRLIEQVKTLARLQNKSLSQLVEEYFQLLTTLTTNKVALPTETLPPITQLLVGILKGYDVDEKEYKEYREAKYL